MIKPPLNVTKLPPVFDIPRCTNYIPKPKGNNIQVIHYPRVNLEPLPIKPMLVNQKLNNTILNKSIVSTSYWDQNSIINNGRRPLLKPIELKNKAKNKDVMNMQKHNQMILEEDNDLQYTLFPNINLSSERDIIIKDHINNNNSNKKALIQEQFSKTSLFYASTMISKMQNLNANINTSMNYLNISNTLIDKFISSCYEFIYIDKTKSKALHLPTLKIYNVFHIGFDLLHENSNNFISIWNKMEHSICEILLQYKNNDNKCIDIFIEKAENGTLENVLKFNGSINENILRQLTRQIILIIPYLNKKLIDLNWDFMEMYQILNEDNICFDYKNNIKLFPSILKTQSSTNKEIFNNNIKTFINNKINSNTNITLAKLKESVFYFYYGITLLNTHLNIYDINIYDLIATSFNSFPHEQMNTYCCLYHFIIQHNELASQYLNESFFSKEYISFLHVITSFSFTCNGDIINKETWITMNTCIPAPTLTDLINVGKIYDYDSIYYSSINDIINFDMLCYNIKNNLPNCVDYFNFHSIKHHHYIFSSFRLDINELARELKVDVETVESNLVKIYQYYFDHKNK